MTNEAEAARRSLDPTATLLGRWDEQGVPPVFINYLSYGERGSDGGPGDAYAASFLDHLLIARGGLARKKFFSPPDQYRPEEILSE